MNSANEENDPRIARTLRLSILDGFSWSVMTGFGDMFIAPFAIFLGASNRAVALIATMPHLLGSLAQMAGAHWADRLKKRRGLMVPLATLQAILFLPLVVAPLRWDNFAIPLLLFFAALTLMAGHAVIPVWLSMMGDIVPSARRGDYFGQRGRVVILGIFASHLLAGGVLTLFQRHHHAAAGFVTVFLVASVARLISVRLLVLHDDPPYDLPADTYFSFLQFLRRLPHSNFARFALFQALMIGTTNIAAPFFAVYMLRDLGWTYAQFTVNAAAFLMTQFIMIRWWGRIGDRHGNRTVVIATTIILTVLPLLWMISPNYIYLLWVQCVAGVGWSGFGISVQNYTFDAVSPPKRARVASYVSLLNGICALIGGTVIGAWLANHLPASCTFGAVEVRFVSSLPWVFLASSLARGLAVLVMVRHFREVREVAEPVHPASLIFRVAGGEAIHFFRAQAARLTRR